ncbi:NAD(P)-binding protein [Hymenopellis radicata]|nr:NAD(P)-binding protein [Hymenopellis radicata]
MADTYKRVILVTGANTGVGFEVVKILAEKGHRVYLGARNQEKGLAAQAKLVAEGLDVCFILLDAEGHLDSLVNNAGVGLLHDSSGPLTEPLSIIHDAMAVNFYGPITVCQAFVPLLLRAPAGKACIVNVSTHMGSNGKAAANSYTVALAKALEGKVRVNAATPGFVSSQLNGFAAGGKTWRAGAEIIAPWAEEKDRTCVFWGDSGEALSW